MYQKVMFGPLDKPENRDEKVRDLSWTERVVFGVIVVLALGMGLVPGPILSRSEASVDALVETVPRALGRGAEHARRARRAC